MKTEFLTPVGRFVQGDPFEKQTENMQGQPLVTRSGEATQRYFVAMAFPKVVNGQQNAEFFAFWQLLETTGKTGFPALNPLPFWDQNCRFSWKVMDGDGVDDNGKPNANKPGMAGHWVVKFSSSFPPKVFYAGRYAPHEQVNDPKAYNRGYYGRIAGTVESNGNVQKPGIYVNLSMVELVGGQPSDIIQTGPDASAVFGAHAAALPAGVAPIAAAMPMPGAAQPAAMPGAALPMPGSPAPATPGMAFPAATAMASPSSLPGMPAQPTAVQPNHAFLQGPGAVPGMPQPGGPIPGMPAAQPVRQLTALAQGWTYEALIAGGHNDASLRAAGLML